MIGRAGDVEPPWTMYGVGELIPGDLVLIVRRQDGGSWSSILDIVTRVEQRSREMVLEPARLYLAALPARDEYVMVDGWTRIYKRTAR
jgi:hypothetical protein